MRQRYSRRTVLALGGAAALAIPAGAMAAGAGAPTGTSGAPQTLSGPVSGHLAANGGGTFALYQFAYPGDGSAVRLTLTTDTATPLASGAAGVNVYQNGARVATGSASGPFALTAVFSSSTGGPVFVQVFNYDPVNAINYTLTAQGLPALTGSVPTTSATATTSTVSSTTSASQTATATASASTAGRPTPLTGPVSGRLAGNTGGSFALYQFTQTGMGATITFVLTADNAVPIHSGAAGLKIYQNGNLLTSSSLSGPAQQTAAIAPTIGGVVVVQVFNYDAQNPITYTLTPTGLPAQPFVSTPASSTTATAAVSSATSSSSTTSAAPAPFSGQAKGVLAGLNGGSFAYYTLQYAGNSQPVTLTLTVFPAVDLTNGAAGLNIYDTGGQLAATAKPNASGVYSAQILSNTAGKYTLQVFNYDRQTTIIYTLTQS